MKNPEATFELQKSVRAADETIGKSSKLKKSNETVLAQMVYKVGISSIKVPTGLSKYNKDSTMPEMKDASTQADDLAVVDFKI